MVVSGSSLIKIAKSINSLLLVKRSSPWTTVRDVKIVDS